jgi:hypothetical protein
MNLEMEKESLISNRVSSSGLITLDPERFRPQGEIQEYDLKQNLYLEQILREKEFRNFLSLHDWTQYKGKHVAVHSSVDAIIPLWAYMLLSGYLQPYAKTVSKGTVEEVQNKLWLEEIHSLDLELFRDKKVVVKGCGDAFIPESVYMALTLKLKPMVRSLMFGEPCSTVPLFKKGLSFQEES